MCWTSLWGVIRQSGLPHYEEEEEAEEKGDGNIVRKDAKFRPQRGTLSVACHQYWSSSSSVSFTHIRIVVHLVLFSFAIHFSVFLILSLLLQALFQKLLLLHLFTFLSIAVSSYWYIDLSFVNYSVLQTKLCCFVLQMNCIKNQSVIISSAVWRRKLWEVFFLSLPPPPT